MRRLWIDHSQNDQKEWQTLIQQAGLTPGEVVDEVYGLFLADHLIASGALAKNVIKYVAVDPNYQGESVFHRLVTVLTQALYRQGYTKALMYTKPIHRKCFEALHFTVLAETEQVCFLEKGTPSLFEYLAGIKKQETGDSIFGAIVMNANPFTLGHRYLIEQAIRQCDHLYVFVVSGDQSLFTTREHVQLVKEGTMDLQQVSICETSDYMVSMATFPSYFLQGDTKKVGAQATLDATLFLEQIAPCLNIQKRFVGEEPYSETTARYNQMLKAVFKDQLSLVECHG
ncbi:MAG: [citrate (pro-3S)-lyase] ligase [Aerococcus sp.]|nr:[citrate (pro-3S)-lyase] ligase [Aerococcus sp.]